MPEISPPPPIGTMMRVEIRPVGEQFERDRPLAGDDRRVVIGVDEGEPVVAGQRLGGLARGGEAVALQHDFGAERLGAVDLDERRALAASRSSPGCRGAGRDRRRPGHGCRPTSRRPRRAAAPGSRVSSLFSAPRSLNEPVRCRVSSFRWISQPASSDSAGAAIVGVCATAPAIAAAARRISAIVTGRSFIAQGTSSRVETAAARPGTSQSKSRQRSQQIGEMRRQRVSRLAGGDRSSAIAPARQDR